MQFAAAGDFLKAKLSLRGFRTSKEFSSNLLEVYEGVSLLFDFLPFGIVSHAACVYTSV